MIMIIIIIIIIIIIRIYNNNSNNNKEKEKIDKYRDLARELRKLWKVKTRVVPIVIGALGTIPKGLVGHLESIGVNLDLAKIQKTTLLGTARILRRVLDYQGCRM